MSGKIIKCNTCGEVKELCGKGMCQSCYNKKHYEENREQLKEQSKKYREENKEQINERRRKYHYKNGELSARENRDCSLFIGEHVAERVLSKVFKDLQRMPNCNPGYDFLCRKGMKVDVKSSTLHKGESWSFCINKNTVADYFLCLAFDNITDLNPLRMWLIPGKNINHLIKVGISPSKIWKWKKYELEVKRVVDCCDSMKR